MPAIMSVSDIKLLFTTYIGNIQCVCNQNIIVWRPEQQPGIRYIVECVAANLPGAIRVKIAVASRERGPI